MFRCKVSRIGYTGSAKKMVLVNVGKNCFPRVAEHELMHILGAIHTQNRPDRDDFVEINLDNVQVLIQCLLLTLVPCNVWFYSQRFY